MVALIPHFAGWAQGRAQSLGEQTECMGEGARCCCACAHTVAGPVGECGRRSAAHAVGCSEVVAQKQLEGSSIVIGCIRWQLCFSCCRCQQAGAHPLSGRVCLVTLGWACAAHLSPQLASTPGTTKRCVHFLNTPCQVRCMLVCSCLTLKSLPCGVKAHPITQAGRAGVWMSKPSRKKMIHKPQKSSSSARRALLTLFQNVTDVTGI